METKKRRSTAPFYAAAVVWLAYALLFPLYAPLHYALAAGAAVLAFLVSSALCRSGPVGEAGEETRKKAEEPAKAQPSTGNAELDKMIRDGELAIREMKRLAALAKEKGKIPAKN